jgi:hypothetical protein
LLFFFFKNVVSFRVSHPVPRPVPYPVLLPACGPFSRTKQITVIILLFSIYGKSPDLFRWDGRICSECGIPIRGIAKLAGANSAAISAFADRFEVICVCKKSTLANSS